MPSKLIPMCLLTTKKDNEKSNLSTYSIPNKNWEMNLYVKKYENQSLGNPTLYLK